MVATASSNPWVVLSGRGGHTGDGCGLAPARPCQQPGLPNKETGLAQGK